MAVYNLLNGEDPVLLRECSPVARFDETVGQLLTDLADTMRHHCGIGLAAPQIGVSLQACVVDIGEGVIELVNPRIVGMEGRQTRGESCLSFPGVALELARPETVIVEAKDRYANDIRLEATGALARALCHEIDHLNGILFCDHLSEMELLRQCFLQADGGSFMLETGNPQKRDMKLAADMIADAAWKLELALELLQDHSGHLAGGDERDLDRLSMIAKRVKKTADEWERKLQV